MNEQKLPEKPPVAGVRLCPDNLQSLELDACLENGTL
jgi:hypothetical protein